MQNRKKGDTRAKFEKRQERIAVMVMILCVLPILYIYGKFFMNAFMNQQSGEWTFANWVCQVFCVSFKKKIYGEGNLPLCIVSNFIRLLY